MNNLNDITDQYLFYITSAVLIGFLVLQKVKPKKLKERSLSFKNQPHLKKNKKYVIDLKFNNTENLSKRIFKHRILSFLGASVLNLCLYMIFVSLVDAGIFSSKKLITVKFKEKLVFFSLSFCIVYFHFFDYGIAKIKGFFRFKDKFRFEDLIFTPDHLKVNLFLVLNDTKINPEADLFLREHTKNRYDYIIIPWDDFKYLELITEYSRTPKAYYIIVTNQKKYLLDRQNFVGYEKKFFQLLNLFSVNILSRDSSVSLVTKNRNKIIQAFLYIALLLTLLMLLYE